MLSRFNLYIVVVYFPRSIDYSKNEFPYSFKNVRLMHYDFALYTHMTVKNAYREKYVFDSYEH